MSDITNGEFQEALSDILDYLYDWEKDARIDWQFAGLKQWDPNDEKKLKETGRPALVFDRTRPIIASVAGSEITNRYEPKFLPRDADLNEPDVPFSEAGNKTYKWIRDRGDFEHHESLAFQSALVCGIGCTEMYMDYEFDSDGLLRLVRVPIWEMGWDPGSMEPNLMDARYLIRDRWIDEDEIIQRFGRDLVGHIKALAGNEQPGRSRGFMARIFARTTDDPRNTYFNNKQNKYFDARRKKIRLWEMLRKDRIYRTRIWVPEPLGGGEEFVERGDTQETLEFLRSRVVEHNFDAQAKNDIAMMQHQQQQIQYDQMMQAAQAQGGMIDPETGMPGEPPPPPEPELTPMVDAPIDYIEDFPVTHLLRSYHAGNEVVKQEQLPLKDFPYQFITCFEDFSDQERRYFMGVMRPMRDPQKYANKFFSHAVHQWSSNAKGAMLFEEDLFENLESAKQEWASPTGMIAVGRGKLQTPKPKYEIIPPGPSMSGVESLLQHAIMSISSSAGVSEQYMVGQASDLRRTAASAVSSIKESNLQTISQPFDALRLYKRAQGRLVLGFISNYVQERQLLRLLGPEDSQWIEALKSGKLEDQYEVIVEEAPASKSKQMDVFNKIMETSFIPQLLELGVPIPPAIAKFFPFPADINLSFQQALEQAKQMMEQQQEFQSMQMQMELAMMQQQMAQAMAPPEEQVAPEGEGGPPIEGEE